MLQPTGINFKTKMATAGPGYKKQGGSGPRFSGYDDGVRGLENEFA
jgi:hypothetical protein